MNLGRPHLLRIFLSPLWGSVSCGIFKSFYTFIAELLYDSVSSYEEVEMSRRLNTANQSLGTDNENLKLSSCCLLILLHIKDLSPSVDF